MTGWGEIYALLITATGWTWEYIAENMTLPRLHSMSEYWKDTPPVHISVAEFVGVKSKPKSVASSSTSSPSPAPQQSPKDKRGYPTKEAPETLGQAVSAMGGTVIRLGPKKR